MASRTALGGALPGRVVEVHRSFWSCLTCSLSMVRSYRFGRELCTEHGQKTFFFFLTQSAKFAVEKL